MVSKNRATKAKAVQTKPLVVITDADAEPVYVINKTNRELEDRGSSTVILPLSAERWETVENALLDGKEHPDLDLIFDCVHTEKTLLILVDEEDVESGVKQLEDITTEPPTLIVNYKHVKLDRVDDAIDVAVELAKAEKGAIACFSVDRNLAGRLAKTKVPISKFGRRPRGRKSENEDGRVIEHPLLTQIVAQVSAQVTLDVLGILEPRLAALEASQEDLKALTSWLDNTQPARPVRLASRNLKPAARQAVRAS